MSGHQERCYDGSMSCISSLTSNITREWLCTLNLKVRGRSGCGLQCNSPRDTVLGKQMKSSDRTTDDSYKVPTGHISKTIQMRQFWT